MQIGVVGSRRRNSEEDRKLMVVLINIVLATESVIGKNVVFVSGGCRKGADQFIEDEWKIGRWPGAEMVVYSPEFASSMSRWDRVNAYYARNKRVVDNSNLLIALVADNRKGGTENTIEHAIKKKIPIWISYGSGRIERVVS